MGKYEPLSKFLGGRPDDSIDAEFAQVEQILGFPLPQSAYRHQAWWANELHGSHSHARSWQEVGWETSKVDLAARKVRFTRRRNAKPVGTPPASTGSQAELWAKAHRLTGIEDRDALIEAALTALIRREASRQLIALGGTMPDFTVPDRERPTW